LLALLIVGIHVKRQQVSASPASSQLAAFTTHGGAYRSRSAHPNEFHADVHAVNR
jgi:hypothetical protein